MKINIIVSVSENWVIGKDNKLLWRLSDDLKRFKELTTGNTVVMGQKTFESLPKGALPNRTNIVLTWDQNFTATNVIPVYNMGQVFDKAKELHGIDCNLFVIGGGMIYKQFLDYADKVYLTVVHTTIDGDTTFPEIIENQWNLISEEYKDKDEKNEYPHTYKIYERKY